MRSQERERRIGANEALFRQVNERMRDLNETFATFTRTMDVMCECGAAECSERISMEPNVYERVRSDPHLFVVTPGHEALDVEYIVERHSSYEVLRKREGLPAQIAEETDPRS